MELKYKPNFAEAKKYWEAYWNKSIIDRPCVYITAPKNPANPVLRVPYMSGINGNYKEALEQFENWADNTYFLGEAIPSFDISYGPDEFGAFVGAELHIADEENTSWVTPFVNDWKNAEINLNEEPGSVWNRMKEYLKFAADYSENKFIINTIDFHTNLDLLSAIRGPQNLCMDLLDYPDEVESGLMKARKLFPVVYNKLYEIGKMKERGTTSWLPFYCKDKFAVIECDFVCMISPNDSRRFLIPALTEEAEFLDHAIFHLDGVNALPHCDDILKIDAIDGIQWVPGDGKAPMLEWMDLLKKIQSHGKGLFLQAKPEEVKKFHKELKPEGVFYMVDASSLKEADDLLAWLKLNT
jgi:hypothetical protein